MNNLLIKYILSVSLLLLLSIEGRTQISLDNYQVINTEIGLPTNHVAAIVKDNQGFMWFATSKGLCRWDGISIKTFEHNPKDTTSIPGNHLRRNAFVYDTVSNRIFIGTENGLSIFNPQKETFTNFYKFEKATDFLNNINAILVDKNKTLWLGTKSNIVHFYPETKSFKIYQYAEDSNKQLPPENNIFDIKQDLANDSVLWLATLHGLLKFNKYSGQFKSLYFSNNKAPNDLNTFKHIVVLPDRKLYLKTWNSDIVVFNTKTEEFELTLGPFASNSRFHFPMALFPDYPKSNTEIWVSSQLGTGILNTTTNKITFSKKFKNNEGHAFTSSVAFYEGKSVWMTSEYGVITVNLSHKYFDNYFIPPVNEKYWFLSYSLFEDTTNRLLYLGYIRANGLYYFNLKTHTFSLIPLPEKKRSEISIRKIIPINKDSVLILCSTEIYKLSLKNKKLNLLNPKGNDFEKLNDLAVDNNNHFWVASNNSGLQQLNVNNGKLYNVNRVNEFFHKQKKTPFIKELFIDKQNRIWFVNNSSYGYFNPDNNNFKFFNNAKEIRSFFQDKKDTIWASISGHGLGFIISAEAERGVQLYDTNSKKNIHSIQRDSNGNFIFITSAGIEKTEHGKEKKIIVYNETEGLVKYDEWENRDPTELSKLYKLSNGRFAILYRRGIGFFNPNSLQKIKTDFEPYISSVKIAGQSFPIEKTFSPLDIGKLNHNQNALTFDFSALALDNGSDILFYYRLKNVNDKWVSTLHRSVNFSNLQPGNYTFEIKAESKSIPDLSKQASLSFVILPPWWKTWWAYLLYLIFISGVLFSIHRYQLNRQLIQKETKRLRELDKLKSRLYANITHEFRTPLTVIRGMTDEITDKMNREEQNRFNNKLKMIERNSDKLLHLVQQMLDMSKIEEGKMKLDLIRNNIISYLQYIIESFQSMADSKNIKLVFYRETDKVVMDYDQDKIFVIVSNLLTNAVKFTPKGGKIIFHVKTETKNDRQLLILKIQDTGIGIGKEHINHIFDRFYQVDSTHTRKGEGTGIGLALTKELVELMAGEITVKSIPNVTTEFCVSIPVTSRAPLQKTKHTLVNTDNRLAESANIIIENNNKDLPLALIIEDNPDVAKYIISCLKDKYRIQWADDGQKGIDAATKNIPDIVISDVMMPEKDGFEVCETLKQNEGTSHIPIVLLTAKASEQDRIEGLSFGADAYLVKPFNKKELYIRLEQLIKIRKQLQEKYSQIDISLTKKTKLTGEEHFLKKAVNIIEKNLDNSEFNAYLLASELHLSESQLYRKLKALSNKSTALFIREIRLSAAKNLLKTSNLNISEIAYLCGFNDPAWFSRVFKEAYGSSPGTYRK